MDTSAWIKALIFMFSQVLFNASKTFFSCFFVRIYLLILDFMILEELMLKSVSFVGIWVDWVHFLEQFVFCFFVVVVVHLLFSSVLFVFSCFSLSEVYLLCRIVCVLEFGCLFLLFLFCLFLQSYMLCHSERSIGVYMLIICVDYHVLFLFLSFAVPVL